MTFYKYFYTYIFVFFVNFNFSHSQDLSFTINWNDDTLFSNDLHLKISKHLVFDLKTPKISISKPTDRFFRLVLKKVEFEPITNEEVLFINNNNFKIDSTFVFDYSNKIDQNQKFLNVFFSAFIYENGKISRVKSVDFDMENFKVENGKKRGKVLNSVLSDESSKWFKFRVDKHGFFKITYNQLKNLGFDPKALGFSAFHIYGNSYGRLPELNSEYLDLDLIQNSVIYEGIGDGVFDENDAIVFYSSGPNQINLSKDSVFVRDLNIYSDYSSFFLRVSNSVKINEFQTIDNEGYNSNLERSDFLSHYIHEVEDTSLVYGGKRWYGELLDYNNKLEFTVPNFQTQLSDLNISISGATNARTFGSYLNVYLDNQFIEKISLSSISSEFIRIEKSIKLSINSGFKNITIELIRNNPDTKFFLDKIEINAFKSITTSLKGEVISNPKLVGKGFFKFNFQDKNDGFLFDISQPTRIKKISMEKFNNFYYLIDSMISLKKYMFYNYSDAIQVNDFLSISSQNLHSVDLVDLIIVSPIDFIKQANDLKLIHEREGLRCVVVSDQEIYNEFSSGEMDPTAIKQFARLVYNKQENNPKDRLKYLLLFGDGTFDYKNRIKGNNNFIPTFQVEESEDFLSAMVSDDYFGMMDEDESLKGSDLLDIGVGRMLISSQKQAEEMISKIQHYLQNLDVQSDWMTKIALITDDEEGGYFVYNDTEPQSKYLSNSHPEINVVKLYSDAFQQVSTAGGERYPMLNSMIDNQFYNGSLVVSYVGHGGPSGAAEERIMTIEQIAKYNNKNKLPLFMSSTCEFTKYDDPTRVSAGEVMYLNPNGGAIALMTTSRPVFFGVNTISGNSFYKNVLQYDSLNNTSLTFGEIFRRTKNQSGTSSNRRSFTLIGDPALKINFPSKKIIIDSINSLSKESFKDTLKALTKVSFNGHIESSDGSKLIQNGTLMLSLYDKSKKSKTLGQNISSPVIEFETQNSLLFKGLANVKNGNFKVDFILPKDIDYAVGKGKISTVSILESDKGIGAYDGILVGGISLNVEKDSIGPEIVLSLDSNRVIDNGTFTKNPTLYIKLEDESGINLSSSGIGHQISLIVDDKSNEIVDLSENYVADVDTYKRGKIRYLLPELTDGKHKLKVKAWDVFNNSTEKELTFTINNSQSLNLNRVFNYPNPFTTQTSFYIEQNTSQANLKIEIYSVSGKLIKEYFKENVSFRTSLERVFDWDGLDQYGDKLAKGVYVYKVSLSNQSGSSSKMEKLVIF